MVEKSKVRICVYTDGSCGSESHHSRGPGGWAAVFMVDGKVCYELAGHCANTTNNRMELQAAIEALRFWRSSGLVYKRVCLFTDSRYVLNGIETWIDLWRARGWLTTDGLPVQNQDLWQELARLNRQCLTRWHYVRGHAGNVGNERADALAGSNRLGFGLEMKQDLDLLHRVVADRVAV